MPVKSGLNAAAMKNALKPIRSVRSSAALEFSPNATYARYRRSINSSVEIAHPSRRPSPINPPSTRNRM